MKMVRGTLTLTACFALAMVASTVAGAADRVGDPYPLNVCPVTGEPLGSMGDPIIAIGEGREARLCCGGCEPKFSADPAKYFAKIDAEMIKEQEKHYPIETCVVSGKVLDGNAETRIIANRMMKFCCGNCPAAAAADPAKFIAKLDKAVIAAQSDSYPLTKCVISGKALDSMGEPVNLVIANRLIKLCCAGCEGKVEKTPAAALAALDGKTIKEGSAKK